jgi:ketosteroid isomerase-like protein
MEEDMSRREQIESLNAELSKAAANKDTAGIAAFYEEGARLLPPGAPIVEGRENILARFNAFIPNAKSMSMVFDLVDVIEAGDVVIDISRMTVSVERPSGESASHVSKHVVVWRQQPDGDLKIVVEAINRDA